ncbi:Uncharacterized protein CTYZ_00002768 [Cryptosporidium tyzzeri]|nr:Uncharacterized protein CTYZ_00002768 [Cryptosporidium tyzzeri]
MKALFLAFLIIFIGGWGGGKLVRVESLKTSAKRYQERERVPSRLPPPREEPPVFQRYLYSYPKDYGYYFFNRISDSNYWDRINGENKQIPIEGWQWDNTSNNWLWGPLRNQDGTPLLPLSPELEAPRAYVGPTRIYGPIQVDDLPIPRVLDIICKPYESLIGIRAWFPNPESKGRKDLRGIQFLCSSPLDTRVKGGSKHSTWSRIMGNVGPNLKKYTVLTRPEDPFVKIRVFVETLNPVKHQSQRELVIPTYQGPRLVYIDNQEEALEKGPIYLIRRITLRTKNNHLSFLGKAGGNLPSVVESAPEGYELSGFRILISGYPRSKWRGADFSTLAYRNSMSLGFLFSKTEDILSRPQIIYGRRGYDFQDIKCDGKITGLQGFFMGNRGLVGIKVECDRVWQEVILGITEGTDYKALVGSMISAVSLHLSPEKFIQSLVVFSTTGRQQKLGDDWVTPTIRSSKSEGGGRGKILQGIFAELDKTGAISGIGFHWKKPPKPGQAGDREDYGNLEVSESPLEGEDSGSLGNSSKKEIVPRSSFYGRVAKDCPILETKCPTGVPLTGLRLIMRKGETQPKPFKMYLVSLAIQCGDEFFKPVGNPNLIEAGKKRTYDILIHEEDPVVDFRVYLGDLGLPHLFDLRFKHDVLSSYELYGFRVAMMIRSERIGAIAPLYRVATPIDLPPITAKEISIRLFGAVRPESDPDVVVLETSCPPGIPITAVRMWFVRKIEGNNVFSRLVGLRIRCGSKWRKTKLGSSMGDRFEAEVESGDFFSRSFVENQSEKPFYVSGIMLVTLENRKSSFGETGTEIMKKLASGDVESEIYGFIGQETPEGLVSIGFLERKANYDDYPTFNDIEVAPYQVSASDIQGESESSLNEEKLIESGIVNFRPGEEWFGRRGLGGSHAEETFCAPGSRLTGLLVHTSTKIPHSIIGLTLICDGKPLNPVGSTLGDIARYEIPMNEPIEKVEVVLNKEDRSLSRLKLFNRNHMKKKMGKLHDRFLSGFDVEIRKGVITALSAIYTNFGDSGPPPKVRTVLGSNQVGSGSAPITDRNTPWGHANANGDVSTGDEYSCEEGTKLTQITMAYKRNSIEQKQELIGLRITCNDEDYEQVGMWDVSDSNYILVEETFGLREKEFIIAIGGTRIDKTHSIGKLYFETNLLRQFGEWQHYYVEAKTKGDGLYGFELLFEKTGDYTTPIAMLLPLFRPTSMDTRSEDLEEKKYKSPFELPKAVAESSEEANEQEMRGMLSSPTIVTDWIGLDVGSLEMDGIWCKTSRLKLDGRMTWEDWRNSRMTGLRVYNDGDHIKGIALQCGNSWLEEANLGLVGPKFHFDEISDCLESDADYIENIEVAIDSRGIPAGFKVFSHVKRQKKVLINNNSLVTWQSNIPDSGNHYASGIHVEYDPDTNIIFRVRIVYRPISIAEDPEENVGFIF